MRIVILLATVLAVAALTAPGTAAIGPAPAIEWQRLLGGNQNENVGPTTPAARTTDGGCILFGHTLSSASGDVTDINPNPSWYDSWVVKLDSGGVIQWQKLLGGDHEEAGWSVANTADGGYVLLGMSTSSQSRDVAEINHGAGDIWVVKLDGEGLIQWQRLLGGSRWE